MNRTKAKNLILILIFFIVFVLYSANKVNAMNKEEEQELLDLIPDEITLDIPEIEFEKANNMLKDKVEQIWKENGINLDDIGSISFSAYYPYDINRFYEGNVHTGTISKNIKISYNNTNDKTTTDEQYVKKLKIEKPNYYEINADTSLKVIDEVQKYYDNIINDKSIVIKYIVSSGELTPDNLNKYDGTGNVILIFKDNNLYDIRYLETEFTAIPVINVPSNISDSNVNHYIITKAQEFYSVYNAVFTNVEKGCSWNSEYVNIPNIYTLTRSDNSNVAVIVNREIEKLNIQDETTNIKINTDTSVLPSNTQLVVNQLKEGQVYETATRVLNDLVDKMYMYDITLENEGVEIQPNGKVKVSIPIPEGVDTSKLVVYRIDDEENKTEYEVKVETIDNVKYATFETDHFSTYVLAEEKTEQNTTNENVSEVKGEKDNTPKTGTASTTLGMIALVSILGIGIIVLIKKHK